MELFGIDGSTPPHIVTAYAALAGALIGSFGNGLAQLIVNWRRTTADGKLADRRFEFDKNLAEQKFQHERQQAIFRRKFELAESWLADVYRFRELVGFVRNGFARAGEGEQRNPNPGETESIKRLKDTYFVPTERLNSQSEFIAGLMAKQHACQALFGDAAKESFEKCSEAITHIRTASSMLIELMQSDGHFADKELGEKLLADIWAGYARASKRDDTIAVMVERAVAVAENLCRPVLQHDRGQPV